MGVPTWRIQQIMLSPSFHRVMTKEEAELVLQEHASNTCYLTRYDASTKTFYLSVKAIVEDGTPAKFHHFILTIAEIDPIYVNPIGMDSTPPEIGYELNGTQKKFKRISELLAFYETIPVNFEVVCIGEQVCSKFIVSFHKGCSQY